MRREGYRGHRSVTVVGKRSEDFLIQWATMAVDKLLLAPADAIPYEAISYVQTVQLLLIDIDNQLEWIADFDVFS